MQSTEQLTPAMREWLATQPADVLLRDYILRFQVRFSLTPEQAGELLGVWVHANVWNKVAA